MDSSQFFINSTSNCTLTDKNLPLYLRPSIQTYIMVLWFHYKNFAHNNFVNVSFQSRMVWQWVSDTSHSIIWHIKTKTYHVSIHQKWAVFDKKKLNYARFISHKPKSNHILCFHDLCYFVVSKDLFFVL